MLVELAFLLNIGEGVVAQFEMIAADVASFVT